MKKVISRVFCLLALLSLSACAGTTIPDVGIGVIVTDTKEGVAANNGVRVVKTGKACATNILGIVAQGDYTIEAAKRNGQIKQIATIDREFFSVLGVYGKVCTVVAGQ